MTRDRLLALARDGQLEGLILYARWPGGSEAESASAFRPVCLSATPADRADRLELEPADIASPRVGLIDAQGFTVLRIHDCLWYAVRERQNA